MTDPALPHPDPDAALREEIARAGFAGWYGRDEYDEHPVQGMWERAADSIMAGPLATLRARATAAEAELAAVDLALEGLAETPRGERICHWIGVAADAETRAAAAEAERDKLRSELAAALAQHPDTVSQPGTGGETR